MEINVIKVDLKEIQAFAYYFSRKTIFNLSTTSVICMAGQILIYLK
jgi:hypothetical protein